MTTLGAKYVLDDDDAAVEKPASIATFEVEQPRSAKASLAQQKKGKTFDVFVEQDKDIRSFQGYHAPLHKTILFYVIGVLTCGLSFLAAKWNPKIHILLTLSKCSLKEAQFVRITLTDGRVYLEEVKFVDAHETYDSQPSVSDGHSKGHLIEWQMYKRHKLLEYRCNRYFFIDTINSFIPVPAVPKGFNDQLQKSAIQVASSGRVTDLDEPSWDLLDRQMRYGSNEMAIPITSIPMIIFKEMWHPFYVFQYFAVIIWIVGDQYYIFSVCILAITWFSIITNALETHRNMVRLKGIAHYACDVEVMREGDMVKVSSMELVPGDIVVLDAGVLPCDLVLLSGECIVDENMLTGESVPVRKTPYSPVTDGLGYDPDKHSSCTLYGGTSVAQARGVKGHKAVAVVCRTRFYSAKGQLLRSILFPSELNESFISDSLKFIAVMLTAAILLYIWGMLTLIAVGASTSRIVIRFFDMITVAVPPSLPACLTIATVFSIGRLRKKGVYVTSPDRINVAGQLDVICFDKTGTLTEQGLELMGIVPMLNGAFTAMQRSLASLPESISELLATCHGLARMGEQLVGDPLDQKLFAATGWQLHDDQQAAHDEADEDVHINTWVCPANQPGKAYKIKRRFEFSSALMRNTVVVSKVGGATHVFVKGSPEVLRTIIQPESIPDNFDAVLGSYTKEGYRVLAIAAADASALTPEQISGWSQEQLEGSVPLELVGLVVMANSLREDSTFVIEQLKAAQIRCVMVTGDHLRTAVSVAHQCGIMPDNRPICLIDGNDRNSSEPPFRISVLNTDGTVNEGVAKAAILPKVLLGDYEVAVTGKGFSRMLDSPDPDVVQAALQRSTVFARMSPDNKKDLVHLIGRGLDAYPLCPHLGLYVGFCGDGANDCGALKAAHVGVSLCEAEASVAAPMTSNQQTIASMITVVAEGRCTLMATYQIFQFIIGYAMVQAFSTNLMYTYALNFGNYQYLIEDLFYTTISASLMGYTRPRSRLSSQRPFPRVLSWPLMMSTVLQLLVVVVFQMAGLAALHSQPGYVRTLGPPSIQQVTSAENTTTYIICLSQFIILALVFNKGHPHRAPLRTNYGLVAALVAQVIFLIYTIFGSSAFNSNVQQLMPFDSIIDGKFRGVLVGIIIANLVVAVFAEFLCAGVMWTVRRSQRGLRYRQSKSESVRLTSSSSSGQGQPAFL